MYVNQDGITILDNDIKVFRRTVSNCMSGLRTGFLSLIASALSSFKGGVVLMFVKYYKLPQHKSANDITVHS